MGDGHVKVPESNAVDGPSRSRTTADTVGSRRALLGWYRPRARSLRIRESRDPWAILVSEVMAQQTQIERVDVAWVEFMQRFPTVRSVALATSAEIIRAWAGLGYNRRALNLQRAAVVIVEQHDGRVPREVEALMALPGVGPYTARAVAALAFGMRAAAVDTNVRRVLTRLERRDLSERELQHRADALLDPDDPGTWTQAMMDLGATVCRSRAAECDICPLAPWCASAGRVEVAEQRVKRGAPVPFERTTRWLRGRIVADLRASPGDAWTTLPRAIGSHQPAAVAAAVEDLAREGLVEKGPDGRLRLPSGVP